LQLRGFKDVLHSVHVASPVADLIVRRPEQLNRRNHRELT